VQRKRSFGHIGLLQSDPVVDRRCITVVGEFAIAVTALDVHRAVRVEAVGFNVSVGSFSVTSWAGVGWCQRSDVFRKSRFAVCNVPVQNYPKLKLRTAQVT
jgi:hypothetical protein